MFVPDVLFEDNHLLVVNKPAGLLTQPDNTGQPSLLEGCREWLRVKYQKPGAAYLEPVHRIDKPVSGVVLFAKTSKALSRLNESMRSKEIKKTYRAQVSGELSPSAGTFVHYLIHGDYRAIVARKMDGGAKEARLHYKILSSDKDKKWLEIDLETGRYHQIRAQFAAVGCPIVGDIKYGSSAVYAKEGIALHHFSMEIPHPITKEIMVFTAQSPF